MQIIVLNIFHIIIIYFSLFGLSFLGLLVGTTIANWLEYIISTKRSSTSFDRISLLILSLIVITMFYSLHFASEYIIRHPESKNWIFFYPSYWYSNLILYIIDPSLQNLYILDLWFSLILALLIPILSLYISYKLANKYFTLVESPQKITLSITQESTFYKIIRKLTFSKIRVFVIIHFKNFLRKKENIAKLFYIIGLTGIIGIIIALSLKDISKELGVEFLYIKEIIILLLSWTGGIIFGILIGTNIFISSKEILYLYKRTPRGITFFIFSYVYQMLYLIVFLALILTIIFSVLFQLTFLYSCLFFIFFLLNSSAFLLQAIGIQCYNPLFEERGKDMFLNIYLIIFLQIISLVISLYLVMPNISYSKDPTKGLINILIINLEASFVIAIILLFIGTQKLKRKQR